MIAGYSTIHSCSANVDVIRQLMRLGVNINALGPRGRTPLNKAVMSGGKERVVALLEAGASTDIPDAQGYFPIHSAVEKADRLEIVQILLKHNPKLAKQKHAVTKKMPEEYTEDEAMRLALKKAKAKKKK